MQWGKRYTQPVDVHRALRVQAALHGHSTEAEVREILATSVKPETRVRLVDALAALGCQIGVSVTLAEDTAPHEAASVKVIDPWASAWS